MRFSGAVKKLLLFIGALPLTWLAYAQTDYYLFESGHVRPLALSPDGAQLYAVNTPDNRLEIFAVSDEGLTHTASGTADCPSEQG